MHVVLGVRERQLHGRRLLHDDTPDTGCGLKLFPRALFLDLPYFDHMHRFLPALVLRAGGAVRSVPVNHRPRQRGASKYGVLDRLFVGIVEITAGLAVALKPRYGAYLVAAWLAGIVVNLLTYSGYYDIALRDFGLMLGALTLARLASVYDPPLRR